MPVCAMCEHRMPGLKEAHLLMHWLVFRPVLQAPRLPPHGGPAQNGRRIEGCAP